MHAFAALLTGALALPETALAHSAIAGMEGLGAGLVHPIVTMHHFFLLLALGILAGQRRPLNIKVPMLLFASLSGTALFLTTRFTAPDALKLFILGMALCFALLLAAAVALPEWFFAPLFSVSAVLLGLDSGVPASAPASATLVTLVAIWIGANVLLVNIAYYTSLSPQKKWLHIGFRVAGSWMAAICLMVLALALTNQVDRF